jgi:hypothetical protein
VLGPAPAGLEYEAADLRTAHTQDLCASCANGRTSSGAAKSRCSMV